jgi:2-C-methyl-D-erythritol 4-phosphate cytidylyltransferase
VPILLRTVAAFDAVAVVGRIVVVAPPSHLRRVRLLLRAAALRSAWLAVPGGSERQDSVWNGLEALDPLPEIVLVHDAVRPLVTERMIREVIRATGRHGAAIAAVPVKDTIRQMGGGRGGGTSRTLDRSRLRAVQTPQGFRAEILLKAHRKARREGFLGTDEASLVERIGVPVRLVMGDYRNIKITTPEDLATASLYVS